MRSGVGQFWRCCASRFATLKLDALAIDRITLFKQDDAKARFRIIGEWALARMDLSASSQD